MHIYIKFIVHVGVNTKCEINTIGQSGKWHVSHRYIFV